MAPRLHARRQAETAAEVGYNAQGEGDYHRIFQFWDRCFHCSGRTLPRKIEFIVIQLQSLGEILLKPSQRKKRDSGKRDMDRA